MGMNTAAIILNDALHSIEGDPEIGKRIGHGIASAHREDGGVTARGTHGIHIDAIRVLPPAHADYYQVVLVGGNTIKRLSTAFSSDPERILRDMADQLGFALRKKRAALSPNKETDR